MQGALALTGDEGPDCVENRVPQTESEYRRGHNFPAPQLELSRERVENILLTVEVASPDGTRYVGESLRVCGEVYRSDTGGEEVLAHMVFDRRVVGCGKNLAAAIEDMLEMLVDDLHFYLNRSENELTADGLQLKERLQALFQRI